MSNKLDMVNSVLLEINESEVNSLEKSRFVRNVLRIMDRSRKTTLLNKNNGWTFNRTYFIPPANSNGEYIVPEGTLGIELQGVSGIVIKEDKLYNVYKNSFTDIPVHNITALIRDIDYEDLNMLIDNVVVFHTAWRFKKINNWSQKDIDDAWTQYALSLNELQEADIYAFQQDPNSLRTNNHNQYTRETSQSLQVLV